MRTHHAAFVALPLLALTLAGCGGSDERTDVAAGPSEEGICADAADGDLLAEICDSGTLTVSTDPAYPPQSSLDKDSGD